MSAVVPFTPEATLSDRSLVHFALDLSAEGIAICEQGRVVYSNTAFAIALGYPSANEIQNACLSDLVPGDHPCLRAGQGSVPALGSAERGTSVCDFVVTDGEGNRVSIQASCSRFQAEGRDLLLISVGSVRHQERRRVTRDGDRRYRAIFDAAAIGMVQCDTEGRVLESNPALQRMLGYSREELRGMHFREFTHPDDLAADATLFNEMVGGNRDYYQIELRYLAKNKVTGWVRLTVSLVTGPDGRPVSVIGMAEDITERKRTEQQLREAQKMEVIGRLVGGVAHDFNNLLTGIMLYCDLIRDGLDENSRLRHHAEEIHLAGEQGAALVQQLLSVARQQPVDPRILSVNEIVAGMRNLLRRLITENIRFEMQLDPELWPVRMDPTQVQQVILNLALNARDAMPEGGCIRVETSNITPVSGNAFVELAVSDNGCGISPDIRAHLFEPFFTTKGQGNGLGLATVDSIVRQCGGSIDLTSELGRGTRFAIRLPRAQESGVAAPVSIPVARQGGGTVLVVEDNAIVRQSAVHILQQSGYTVLEASNGQQALKLCRHRSGSIDLVLLDLIMPGMNGRQTAEKLRSTHPEIRVLYTSGYENPLHAGERDSVLLFRKPYRADALLKKVREVLSQKPPSTAKRGNES